jgi:hypothetical protein
MMTAAEPSQGMPEVSDRGVWKLADGVSTHMPRDPRSKSTYIHSKVAHVTGIMGVTRRRVMDRRTPRVEGRRTGARAIDKNTSLRYRIISAIRQCG